MTRKRAMIVGDAAGPPEPVTDVLAGLGFSAVTPATRMGDALARIRVEPLDLLIVPLDQLDASQLSALERDIQAKPSLSVIGTAPVANPDLILRAMRAGVHEFLLYPPSAQDLASAVERLARRGGGVPKTGQLVAVYSAKGGLGTTSIAVNMAQAFAVAEPRSSVTLVDFVAGGDVGLFLNLRPTYDIGDLVAKLEDVDAAMLKALMTEGPAGVHVLPANDDAVFDDLLDGATATTIMDHLRDTFDITVVDCEHHLSERTLAVLDAADVIVVVTQPNVPAIRSTQRSLALFRRLGYADGKAHVVVNRYQSGDLFTLANVSESLKRDVYWNLPNDYRTSALSLNKGVSVNETDASSKLARSYAQLATKLRGKAAQGTRATQQVAPPRSRLRNLFGRNGGSPGVA